MVQEAYTLLSDAAQQGVLMSIGWVALIPRVLGVAATLNQWWDIAAAHFEAAMAAASRIGAQAELGRSYLDYARMLRWRGETSDHPRIIVLGEQALALCTALGMTPFVRQATQLLEELQASTFPQSQQRDPFRPHRSQPEEALGLQLARNASSFLR